MSKTKEEPVEKFVRLKRIELPGECPGEIIFLPKTKYEDFMKKVEVISSKAFSASSGLPARIVIDFRSRRTSNRGTVEFYDIGPGKDFINEKGMINTHEHRA